MKKRTIELTKNEYLALVRAVLLGGMVYGALHDFVDERFHLDMSTMDRAEHLLAEVAEQFDAEELLEDEEERAELAGKEEDEENVEEETHFSLESPLYEKLERDMETYDEHTTDNTLANKLAWRDFRREHSDAVIEGMAHARGHG
ncbi:hypothetical protein CO157_05075, partial [Candidatus Peregrinibacteria bacterium CG_4_9_14_3_um_filter_49_12]